MADEIIKAVPLPQIAQAGTPHGDLQAFENGMIKFIADIGIPTTNVLVPVSERVKVFRNVEEVIALLSPEQKQQALYIAKFIAASASGLFDSALNYLWDETIAQLRKRIANYDLEYFFDLAVRDSEKRKRLATEDDLSRIDDSELIHGATQLGLVSELGFRHLDYIRYMRNWASAAHPNQNQITGHQLIAWLETCIKEVITLPETNIAARTKTLLGNIKTHPLDSNKAKQVGNFLTELTTEQCNNLIAGLFGIFTNSSSLPVARDNIKLLAPMLWPFVSEGSRQSLGIKYGHFTANNDGTRAS